MNEQKNPLHEPFIGHETMNDFFRRFAGVMVSQIPVAGTVASFVLNTFWPTSPQGDLWEQVRAKTEALVDSKILKLQMEERTNEINSLKDHLASYDQSDEDRKIQILTIMISKSNQIFHKLTESANSIHFIPISLPFSLLHLYLHREQVICCKKLSSEKDISQATMELSEQITAYKAFFNRIYPQWKGWRFGQITTEITGEAAGFFWLGRKNTGKVQDNVTGQEIILKQHDATGSGEDYSEQVNFTKQRMENDVNAGMIDMLAITDSLHCFLPGDENKPPVVDENLRTLELGIYSNTTFGQSTERLRQLATDTPGKLKEMIVHHGSVLNALQCRYNDHDGNVFGSAEGEKTTTVTVKKDNPVIGVQVGRGGFGVLVGIRFQFKDKTWSEPFGSIRDNDPELLLAIPSSCYEVTGMACNHGSFTTGGSNGIKLHFSHSAVM